MNPNNHIDHKSLQLTNYEIFDVINPDINWKRVYCAYFQSIPSTKSIPDVNLKRVVKWIEAELADHIVKRHSSERCGTKRRPDREEVVYVLDNQCMVHIENRGCSAYVYFSDRPEEAQALADSIRKFRQRQTESWISVVVSETHGLSLTSLKLKQPRFNIQTNYNDDLVVLHEGIVQNLRKKKTSGLTMFHGMPGTGKSTYLRYLIGLINKQVIFLPPTLAGSMDNPQITSLLADHPGTIIIIEDAENLLVSRDKETNSGISMLLNLTDGLLGAALGIQFICTFNTHVSNIDKALLRKGRLTTLYEFKALSETKAKELLHDLHVDNFTPAQPMTLAEIFNFDQQGFEYERKLNPIGFNGKVA